MRKRTKEIKWHRPFHAEAMLQIQKMLVKSPHPPSHNTIYYYAFSDEAEEKGGGIDEMTGFPVDLAWLDVEDAWYGEIDGRSVIFADSALLRKEGLLGSNKVDKWASTVGRNAPGKSGRQGPDQT